MTASFYASIVKLSTRKDIECKVSQEVLSEYNEISIIISTKFIFSLEAYFRKIFL